MEDLSLHILDVAENGIRAGADLVRIVIDEDVEQGRLVLIVEDNGRGMEPEFLARVLDPFVTTRTTRSVGMGLSLLQQSAQEADGDLTVESEIGAGTTVRVWMSHGHIDRKPMGNMTETLVTLIQGNPEIDFEYTHKKGNKEYAIDTTELRMELEEIPLNTPEVIDLIRENIASGLDDIGAG